MTTFLASGWGLVSAYILFTTLFSQATVQTKLFSALAALFPLIAVWATIERKRWGRLALLGLSATAIGLFVAATGYYAAISTQMPGVTDRIMDDLKKLPFYDSPATVGVLIMFAVANGLWLRRPTVVAEFEHNKRPTLAIAQRVIATSLVGCWGVIMVASTNLPNSRLGTSGAWNTKPHHTRKMVRRTNRYAKPSPPSAF
jgi:hypothetical protein